MGVYWRDTRFLSGIELRLNGQPVTGAPLVMTADDGEMTLEHAIEGTADRPPLLLRRRLSLSAPPTLEVTLTNPRPDRTYEGRLRVRLQAGLEDLFAVQTMERGADAWAREYLDDRRVDVHADNDVIRFHVRDVDGVERETRVACHGASVEVADATYDVLLPPCESVTHRLVFEFRERPAGRRHWTKPDSGEVPPLFDQLTLTVGDPAVNAVVQRQLADLRLLRSTWEGEPYLAAGAPWYSTVFGRDSLITALQVLELDPSVARGSLRLLASRQGRVVDRTREEEPGKILHEMRQSALCNAGRLVFGRYYGSVDSTPLFLMTLGAYVRRTGDVSLWRELRPNAEAALEWIERFGDHDGDGYLDYEADGGGLAQQAWKDSSDSMVNLDGSLAEPPIAPIEVQGYAWLARLEMAGLLALDGEGDQADRLRREAEDLRRRLLRDYWMGVGRGFAVARQRGGRLVETVTSNPGHLLWVGALPEGLARAAAKRLLRDDMFTGWGIRTYASGQARYDVGSYQLGSVWPHDTGLALSGMAAYGMRRDFARGFRGIIGVAEDDGEHRLPELFSGTANGRPEPYQDACKPQAWAAGSVVHGLTSGVVGLRVHGLHRAIRIAAWLPSWMGGRLNMTGLRVGRHLGPLDMELTGSGADTEVRVLRCPAGVELEIARP